MNPDHDTLFGNMLVVLRGQKWRDMRSALSPAFTGNKMRLMFELVSQCGMQFAQFCEDECTKNGPRVYDMKEIFSKFTNDVIASCAFGIHCDSLRDSGNSFFQMGKKFLDFYSLRAMFKFLTILYTPKIARYFDITFFNNESKRLFVDIITKNMETRERENIIRPDMIHLLMQLKKGQLKETSANTTEDSIGAAEEFSIKNAKVKQAWTDEELIPQCFIFFLAGFDTTSTLMAFTAYELAVNQDVQTKLYNEINDVNNELNGLSLAYEHIQRMKYLDMVIAEALRKWPPSVFTDRVCVKDYQYKDEENDLDFTIEEGSIVWIPILPLHRDEKYFPNPEKFDPERFSDENKSNINFGAYIPFGTGPRNCIGRILHRYCNFLINHFLIYLIGSRFALMEAKVILFHLLSKFSIDVCHETQVPLKLKRTFVGIVPETIKLTLQPRNHENQPF